jgi:hypothetical protein
MIKRQLPEEELKLLTITGADDTGVMTIILKGENIDIASIGTQLILRNIHVELINGYIILIANENTKIYENKTKPVSISKPDNLSRIKISTVNLENLYV